MAFGRTRPGSDFDSEPTSPVRTPAPARTTSGDSGGLSAFIDQGSTFEGKLSFKDTVRIDGRFEGEISSENTLIVGEPGEIEANIHSKTVVVSGSVVGNIEATAKVVLHKTARVEGNVQTGILVVEEGAQINGSLKMTGAGSTPPSSSRKLQAVEGAAE